MRSAEEQVVADGADVGGIAHQLEIPGAVDGIAVEHRPVDAVVIDDEIDQKKANISKILRQIERKKVPCLLYKEIPENAIYANWEGVSFILLDWKLPSAAVSAYVSQGVQLPATAGQASVNDNIKFLKDLRCVCFAPVVIFSNENPQDVIN